MEDWSNTLNTYKQPLDAPGSFLAGRTAALDQQRQALENQTKQFELQKAQGLQQAFANGIDTQVGPPDKNGNPTVTHVFNQDKFLAGLKSLSTSAQLAYKEYVEKAYPQAQTEAASQMVAETQGQGGSLNPQKVSEWLAMHPSAALTGVNVARGQQQAGVESAGKIAPIKASLGLLGVQDNPGAPIGSLQGNQEMQPKIPGIGALGNATTADNVDALPPHERAAKVLALTNAGLPPKSAKSADIADALNRWQSANVGKQLAGVDWFNPSQVMGVGLGVPAAQAEANADLTAKGNALISARQGQKSAAQEIGIKEKTIANADDFNKRGFTGVTGANVDDAQKLQGDVKAIHSSAVQAKQLASDPKKVAALSDDDFGFDVYNIMKNVKNADDVKTISDDAHMSGFIRPGASLGKILSESDGPMDFFKGAFRSNLSKTDRIQLLLSIQLASENAEKNGIARSNMEGKYGPGKMPWEWPQILKEKPSGGSSPTIGEENAKGEIWTGKRWVK